MPVDKRCQGVGMCPYGNRDSMMDEPIRPGAWFGPILNMAMSPAERQNLWRERQRRDESIAPVPIDHDIVTAMIERGRIPEHQSEDLRAVGRVARDLLKAWAAKNIP